MGDEVLANCLWGLEPDSLKGKVPAFLPDVHDVREDLVDYLGEALAWDGMVNELIEELNARGELDNTLVIVSGDHGMPGHAAGEMQFARFWFNGLVAGQLAGSREAWQKRRRLCQP